MWLWLSSVNVYSAKRIFVTGSEKKVILSYSPGDLESIPGLVAYSTGTLSTTSFMMSIPTL